MEKTGHSPGTGGAATAAGIWYQALWTLLQSARARMEREAGHDEKPRELRLVLEPLAGDVIVGGEDAERIVQLKTLSEGSWSLKDVVVRVFPDLYKAVDLGPRPVTYELVTEGRRGQWEGIEGFFRTLESRLQDPASETDFDSAYEELDHNHQFELAGVKSEFWSGTLPTERGVFDRIVSYLHTLPIIKNEPLPQVRRKVWRLLSRFCFKGGWTAERVRKDLRSSLLAIVSERERVDALLTGMVGSLIERSRRNAIVVTPSELFREFGLGDVIPLSRRLHIQQRCANEVRGQADLRDYHLDWDVRLSSPEQQSCNATFLVVTGESGVGKTWRLSAEALSTESMGVVLLRSENNAEQDLQRAADLVWRTAIGQDGALPLKNLSDRVKSVLGPSSGHPWLTVCLDQLSDIPTSRELLARPLENWGVHLVVACSSDVAEVFELHRKTHPDRVDIIRLDIFTPSERDDYLQRRLRDAWAEVPDDVRELMRRPQLADIYCQLLDDQANKGEDNLKGWHPRNEYELVDRYWARLTSPTSGGGYPNARLVRRLAGITLDRGRYPWQEDDLHHAGVQADDLHRLISSGWLRRGGVDRYEIPHERLLNFAVAQELAARCRSRSIAAAPLAGILRGIAFGDTRFGTINLGYALMDWFYLMLAEPEVRTMTSEVLARLQDRMSFDEGTTFDRDLLPTLGSSAIPLLEERLISLACSGEWWKLDAVVEGLTARLSMEPARILALLKDARHCVRRAAMKLLAKRPVPEALEQAWEVHRQMQLNPELFMAEGSSGPDHRENSAIMRGRLYEESFEALKQCAPLRTDWLRSAILSADSEAAPVHDLAYLVANLDDGGETWRSCKSELFRKVRPEKRRCLAVNAGVWRDSDLLPVLQEWTMIEELGPSAVRALVRIDASHAAQSLLQLTEFQLYLHRTWYLPQLFLRARDETRAVLYERINGSADPLQVALVYQGHENEMDERTLNTILDALDRALGQLLESVPSGSTASLHLFRPLALLVGVGRADLLDVFAARAGTSLEDRLTRLMLEIVGPRRSFVTDNLSREPGLILLRKIGGAGHRAVVGAFLGAESQYGKLDAIEAAQIHPSDQHVTGLRRISVSGELWDGGVPLLQVEATYALALHRDFEGLVAGLLRLGRYSPPLEEWLVDDFPKDLTFLFDARRAIRDRDTLRLHGALTAIGLFHDCSMIEEVIPVLRDPPDNDARTVAILALGRLHAANPSVVSLIGEGLRDNSSRFAAVRALCELDTPEARERLLLSLDEQWDIGVALWLAHQEDTASRALDHIVQRLELEPGPHPPSLVDDLYRTVASTTDKLLEEIVRRCPEIHDRLRRIALATETGLWIVGSKAHAIRALAILDPYTARLATRRALIDPSAHDRHLYPPILYSLDSGDARERFLKLSEKEENTAVLRSMAYSLSTGDSEWLRTQLVADQSATRLASCRLAHGPAGTDPVTRELLAALMDDRSERVSEAATDALHHLHAEERAETLTDRLSALAQPFSGGWRFAEAALQVGRVGEESTPYSDWQRRMMRSPVFHQVPGWGVLLDKMLREARGKQSRRSR